MYKLEYTRTIDLRKDIIFLLMSSVFLFSTVCFAQIEKNQTISGSGILVSFNTTGIISLSSPYDPYNANIVGSGKTLGLVDLAYQIGGGDWLDIYKEETKVSQSGSQTVFTDYIKGMPIKMERSFEKTSGGLDWKIRLENKSDFPITIGDISLPLPWNKPFGEDPKENFEKSFTKHQHIAGNGSFIYFTRPSGEPPYLIVMAKPGTQLEYFEESPDFKIFIHSGLSAERKKEGNWRIAQTKYELAPKGKKEATVEYGFRLEWAESYDAMREILYENGLFDTRIIPGMTLPQGLKAKFSLHSKNKIDSIVAEYPNKTDLRFIENKTTGYKIYEVAFHRLGENLLTIYYNGNEKTILEFFSTEALETLIKKRSQFITEKQQHKDSTKWYNGLYSVWDMKNKALRGPDNTDGFDFWWGYVLAADDPALSKAPFLAAKNVFIPDDDEIRSIEYYIKNFVWGGLQRTDKELPNPYGIYGTPNWMVNRDSLLRAGVKNRNLDKMNIWRSYDYPHIVMLYFHMFQIAEFYPEKTTYLDANGYLERAFQTAKAYFTYPYEILPWYDTYKWGCYNELVLLPLIESLESHSRKKDAAWLRNEWEKKVKYFVYDDPYPFRSEYSFDRTAFESSYAFAKYGTLNNMKPDSKLWYDIKLKKWYSHPKVDQEDSREFMERQLLAGLSVRGWLEPSYYFLGSDFSLSYMARMGGWGILDYALNFAEKPWDWLQLGYASYLSSFALMNTGTPESDYGYWFPGKENDGAMGWAFNTQKYSKIWLQDRNNPRGAWNYDGEADLGNGAIFRTASTILVEDPLFGWFSYGGMQEKISGDFHVVPKDGVRNTFWMVSKDSKIGLLLNRDGFKKDVPIIYSPKDKTITATIENRTKGNHLTLLRIVTNDTWEILLDDQPIRFTKTDREVIVELPISKNQHSIKLKKNNSSK
jgi:hypothetical protein